MNALQGYKELLKESCEEGAGTRELNRLRAIISEMESGRRCRQCGSAITHGEAPDSLCGSCRMGFTDSDDKIASDEERDAGTFFRIPRYWRDEE